MADRVLRERVESIYKHPHYSQEKAFEQIFGLASRGKIRLRILEYFAQFSGFRFVIELWQKDEDCRLFSAYEWTEQVIPKLWKKVVLSTQLGVLQDLIEDKLTDDPMMDSTFLDEDMAILFENLNVNRGQPVFDLISAFAFSSKQVEFRKKDWSALHRAVCAMS